ncbi:hypothetical protein ACHAPU_007457 [Fusarium lateritium]
MPPKRPSKNQSGHDNRDDGPTNIAQVHSPATAIWIPMSETVPTERRESVGKPPKTILKRTEGDSAYQILPRACRTSPVKHTPEWKAMKECLGFRSTGHPATCYHVEGVLVGISAFNCEPIIMMKGDDHTSPIGVDNTQGTKLMYQSGKARCGDEIIWLENMLVPGGIAYIKRALWDDLSHEEERYFRKAARREHTLLLKGMNPSGVTRPPLANEAQHFKPLICRSIHPGIGYDQLHYHLRWPPIALFDFPVEMIEGLKHFLGVHQEDNISLNIALVATIVYFDMYHHDGPDEGFTAQSSDFAFKKTKLPALGVFIVYFPHMLRFVEVKHLSAFINPSRFAAINLGKDRIETSPQVSADRFEIRNREIDTKAMRECYYNIRSRHPQIRTDVRFTLIPASMPGTKLSFPPDCKKAEPLSIDLFTICCLDDVRALGLPSYHPTNVYVDSTSNGHSHEKPEHFRHVAGPEWLFSRLIR